MTGENIVCFANDWDADPTSKHQVMKILARTNKVLWVNSIGLRRPGATTQDASRIINKVKKCLAGPVQVAPNLYVLTPLAIPFHDVAGVPTINAWWLSRFVRRHAKKLGMDQFQVWSFMPTTAPLIRYLHPKKVLYYCVDEWSEFTFLNGTLMKEMEESLISQSDIVITSAEKLYESKKGLNPHTYLVPHGVDSDHFAKARLEATPVAPELRDLPRPIIGFWGLVHEWIDLDLIKFIAMRHPEWSIVLVGKVDVECNDLRRLSNVVLVGPRSYNELPGFAKGFTVAILPFKVNRLTENVNPIKLREYLACGLPVVSTALREVQQFAKTVHIGSTPESFLQGLESAVLDTTATAAKNRMESVAPETWVARVESISRLLGRV